MRGDFSAWNKDRSQNFRGTLHQQGRVLLDRDWNAQTEILGEWQETAARDAFGAGVAAVPADESLSFKVTKAEILAAAPMHVEVTVTKGRVWADGLLVESDADSVRTATYLEPPVQSPAGLVTDLPNNLRDAVILETWLEELSPFQNPELLIEPALGGVDTTERVQTAYRFRLYRMAAGETCDSIIPKLKDDFSAKGKLTAELQPDSVSDGDCPVVEGGGYTGFEHRLYRIEIARTDRANESWFKWSQYNGGLVGTGDFDAVNRQVTIHGNKNAIIYSGLTSFYLEALDLDPHLGCWRVVYGAKATLAADHTLTLPAVASEIFNGTIPPAPAKGKRFFRLWNGIERVNDYTAQKDLPDHVGIRLQFDAEAVGNYTPSDFWTFEVRTGEIGNPLVLIPTLPPQGIFYHRVPLAEVHWTGSSVTGTDIEDCRRVFQPLTKLRCCCTYRVGDGMHSWGDFDKIQDAINSLPADGGEICVLPGEYKENLTIKAGSKNITIKGCGKRTEIVAVTDDPVIQVTESQNVTIEALAIFASQKGIGVRLDGPDMTGGQSGPLRDILLESLYIEAATRCAIEAHVGFAVTIRGCDIEMSDEPSDAPGIFFAGDDALIEGNVIRVLSARAKPEGSVSGGDTMDPDLFQPAHQGKGGLQIGGTSERVRIINNLIQGGVGNGITLGSLATTSDGLIYVVYFPGSMGMFDPCNPCKDLDDSQPPLIDGNGNTQIVSAGALYAISIEQNRIYNMGANGIGVAMFFDLEQQDEFISVDHLKIVGNEIRRCLTRKIADIPQPLINSIGYGGIALADVGDLVVRDNVIIDNGSDFRDPVCGIFVLHGEGIDISRNHILNNGAKPTDPLGNAKDVKRGPRGGINILFAVAPVVPITILKQIVPTQGGFPALMAHGNIVSVPLGRALSVTALGPVSVVGNQFTSRGTSLKDLQTFIASTVMILNLGLSNEFYLQLLAFAMLKAGTIKSVGEGRPGLDDLQLGKYLSNGNVLFADNQCSLDLMETGLSLAVSSILILSLDDVSFHDNQCDCNLLDDLVLTQAILLGMSVRVSDNRFKEGLYNAALSAITIGLFNTTTDNQSTHCLWITGVPNLTVDRSNVSFMMINNPVACCSLLVHKDECAAQGKINVGGTIGVAANPTKLRFVPD